MAAGFDLAPEALVAASGDVDRAHATLVAALGDVRAEVTSLVGTGWRGPAATAFLSGYEEWQHGAEQVLAALAGMGGALDVTHRAYVASDDVAADALDRLRVRLGGAA